MTGGEKQMEFTKEELRIIRKALQLVAQAHMVAETADELPIRETAVDVIIRKIRTEEEKE